METDTFLKLYFTYPSFTCTMASKTFFKAKLLSQGLGFSRVKEYGYHPWPVSGPFAGVKFEVQTKDNCEAFKCLRVI